MNKNIFLTTGLLAVLAISYLIFTDTKKSEKPPVALSEKIKTNIAEKNKPIENNVPSTEKNKPSEEESIKPKQAFIPLLNIELFSIVLGKTKKSGFALASYNNASQKAYILGSSFSEGVTLKEIFKDRIIIDNKGYIETIMLTKKVLSKKPNKTTKKESNSNTAKVSLNPRHAGMNLPENIDPPPGSRAGNDAGIPPPPPQPVQNSHLRATDPTDTSLPLYEMNDIPTDREK